MKPAPKRRTPPPVIRWVSVRYVPKPAADFPRLTAFLMREPLPKEPTRA